MSERLHTSILNLRAAVLARRIKLDGHHLSSEEAQHLVRAHGDREAYEGALRQAQQRASFWSRFWWSR